MRARRVASGCEREERTRREEIVQAQWPAACWCVGPGGARSSVEVAQKQCGAEGEGGKAVRGRKRQVGHSSARERMCVPDGSQAAASAKRGRGVKKMVEAQWLAACRERTE